MPKSVLVADDSATMRKAIAMIFATEDFSVTLVDNGLDAVNRARELRPDLVLADCMMPGKSGYEVCELLKSDPGTAHIPVLLLAGTFEPFDENRARGVRADAHVVKPFESGAFLDRVKALVGVGSNTLQAATSYAPVSSGPATSAPRAPTPMAPPPPSMGGLPQQPRPMPGPQGLPGQPMARPPPGMPPQGLPRPPPGMPPQGMRPPAGMPAGLPQGLPGQMRPPGMPPPGMQGQMPMARPPGMGMPPPQGGVPGMPRPVGQIPPGTVPGYRPMGIPQGTSPGLPRPPGGAPLPGAGQPPPQRRDPFGLPAPGPAPQRVESLSLDEPRDGGEALLREALSRASREVIEKIAWEVVPQLAETIIRQELDRLIKDRDQRN